MNRVLALILAGGRGDRLSILSEERAKPAVVFGGKYRIIDFTLSNCVNSGIYNVALLTQYRPHSLNDHIGIGKPWDLDRANGGIRLLQAYQGRGGADWYKGTADAIYQNLEVVERSRADQLLILAGDHVYEMAYEAMVRFHREREAQCTVGVTEVPLEEASRYGLVTLDDDERVVDFVEKPAEPKSTLASMGIYVFERDFLVDVLKKDARNPRSHHDFGGDILPGIMEKERVMGYVFGGYWRDVGTISAYWQANMDLIVDLPEFNLYQSDRLILTKSQNRAPFKAGPRAQVIRSLVCDGCIVNGVVRNSVLSPGVYVEDGAVVEESVIFDDCYIERRAYIHRAILDKEVHVGAETQIGWGDDNTPNIEEPDNLNSGITLVGKRARVPANTRIGRNCIIYPDVVEADFVADTVRSGETVGKG